VRESCVWQLVDQAMNHIPQACQLIINSGKDDKMVHWQMEIHQWIILMIFKERCSCFHNESFVWWWIIQLNDTSLKCLKEKCKLVKVKVKVFIKCWGIHLKE